MSGRLPQGVRAPRCSWPAGCRNTTWDLTGRCPHHRHARPSPPEPGAAPPAADPLAAPSGEALCLADPCLGEAAAALLAARGVTVETWPVWQQAAGAFPADAAGIVIAAIDSGIRFEDLDRLPSGPSGGKLRSYPDVAGGSFTYFDGPAVLAWAAAEPDLGPRDIKALVQRGVRPDDPDYRAYRTAGVSAATSAGWRDAGFEPDEAAGWDHLGVTPEEATYLTAVGRTASDLNDLIPDSYLPVDGWPSWTYSPAARADLWATGVSETDWGRYRRLSISGLAAARLARAGVTPDAYEQWRRHAARADVGRRVDPDLIAAAAEAGATLDDAERLAACGVPPGEWGAIAAAGGTGDQLHETLFFDVFAADTRHAPRAAARADLPAGMYRRLLRHPDTRVAAAAASNRRVDPDDIDAAISDPANPNRDTVVSSAAAAALRRESGLSADLWAAAAASPTVSTRHLLASNPATPPELLTVLAADPAANVRDAAAANPNLPAAGQAAGGLLAD